jgi:hypothetical protein
MKSKEATIRNDLINWMIFLFESFNRTVTVGFIDV